jgi:hypothetical protein
MTFAPLALALALGQDTAPKVAAQVLAIKGQVELTRAKTGQSDPLRLPRDRTLFAGDVVTVLAGGSVTLKAHFGAAPVVSRPRLKAGVKAPELATFSLTPKNGEPDTSWTASIGASPSAKAQQVLNEYSRPGGRSSGAPHPFRSPLEGDRVPVGSFDVRWDAKNMGGPGLIRIEPADGRSQERFEAYVPDLATGRLDAVSATSAKSYARESLEAGRVRLVATVMSREPATARSVLFRICPDSELAGVDDQAAMLGNPDDPGDAALGRSDALLLLGMLSLSSLALEEAVEKVDEDWRGILKGRAAQLYERGLSTYRPR